MRDLVDAKLEAKQAEYGEDVWSQVERVVLLRTIDSLWVEHLTEVDDMRRGIGLRGYAQQDPLNEFRREAYRLYEELRDLIRHQVASTIFRVSVTREPAAAGVMPMPGPGQPARQVGAPAGAGAAATSGTSATSATSATRTAPLGPGQGVLRRPGTAAEPIAGLPADPMRTARQSPGAASSNGNARPGFTPSGARIGRNDPCWCGSGQKYKKCHGA